MVDIWLHCEVRLVERFLAERLSEFAIEIVFSASANWLQRPAKRKIDVGIVPLIAVEIALVFRLQLQS
jgi:hypothetical protein